MKVTSNDLRRLGLRKDNYPFRPHPNCFALGPVRVVLSREGATVIAFRETEGCRGEAARARGDLAWAVRFPSSVPRKVTLAAIHQAVNLSEDE